MIASGLEIYHSSAAVAGASQRDPAACLGGYYSSTPLQRMAALITDPIAPIVIERVAGANGTGTAYLYGIGDDKLAWTAPSGTQGTSTTVSNGSTVELADGGSANKVVVVRRTSTNDIAGLMSLDLVYPFNGPIAMSNVAHADRVAGITTYRALMLYNAGTAITDLYAYTEADHVVSMDWESPSSGAIQVIANETTEPTGRAWNSGTTYGTGITCNLSAGAYQGLWIRRVVGAGATVNARDYKTIYLRWTQGGVTYTETLREYYRLADTSKALYEVYVGTDAEPDFTAAAGGSGAALPLRVAGALPGSGTRTFKVTCCQRNAYNLRSFNRYSHAITIDSTGAEAAAAPSAPTDVSVSEVSGGYLSLQAKYCQHADTAPADTWRIYTTGTGVDPDPATDTYTDVTMEAPASLWTSTYILDTTVGPFAKNADVRVLVRSYRTSDTTASTNTTATQKTITTWMPQTLGYDRALLTTSNYQLRTPPSAVGDVVLDVTNSIKVVCGVGYSDLYIDTTWIWRLRRDGASTSTNGLWTTYGFVQAAQSGAASATPIEYTAGPILYVAVDSIRRMKIDCSAGTVSCAALRTEPTTMYYANGGSANPVYDITHHTLFNVFDPTVNDYVSVGALDATGTFYLDVPWRQRATTGEFA
jgi:hypothetical protein